HILRSIIQFHMIHPPPCHPLFPYTTLFRSGAHRGAEEREPRGALRTCEDDARLGAGAWALSRPPRQSARLDARRLRDWRAPHRSDRKSTRLNSSHLGISYAVFCLKKKILLQ